MQLLTGHRVPTVGPDRGLRRARPTRTTPCCAGICFIKEGQRYPDHFRVRDALDAAAAVFPAWDADLAAQSLLRDFDLPRQAADQEALPRHDLRGRHHHRPGLPGAAHPLRRALPRAGRRRPAALLRPAARRLRRAPAHGRPLHPPDRGDQRPARARPARSTAAGSCSTRTPSPCAAAPLTVTGPRGAGGHLRRRGTSCCTPSRSAGTAAPSSAPPAATGRRRGARAGPLRRTTTCSSWWSP